MADLQERMCKLKKVEQQERFRELIIRINQLINVFIMDSFRVYDEDLASIKEHSILAAAQELVKVMGEVRKLQAELEGR